MIDLHLRDLDPTKVFAALTSQDPETAMRFSLPVPNWQGISHECIKPYKGVDRFLFHNHKDSVQQGAKIDGTGVVLFASITPQQAKKLVTIVEEECQNGLDKMTPDQFSVILDRSYTELGLGDRYSGNKVGDVEQKMHRPGGYTGYSDHFGPFVPNPVGLSAVFLVAADQIAVHGGPTATPQKLEEWGFIVFPKKTPEEVAEIIKRDDPRADFKAVAGDVFLASRVDSNGNKLDTTTLPKQVVVGNQGIRVIRPGSAPPAPHPTGMFPQPV